MSLEQMMESHTTEPRGPWGMRRRLPRVLGDIRGTRPGPSLVIVAAIHGNEPAGALAIERVLGALDGSCTKLRGRVVFLTGNCQASTSGLRFVRRDLNRGWNRANLERLRNLPAHELGDEDQEQLELAQALRGIERAHQGPLMVVDLHTTSAPSAPFVCFGDTLRNRRLAMALPTTAILGLEEVIDGAMVGYCTERGHVGISVGAGQHHDPEAIERHVAAIWLLLVAAGNLPARAVPELRQHRALLARASATQPAVVEVRHRHVVSRGDGFEMLPGFVNFTRVVAGQIVAHDANGPVRAPQTGLLLMPRYQTQGEVGYLVAREVRPVWLKISEWLRKAGASNLVPYLPGIRRDPTRPQFLLVNPRVARARLADVMHLFGYQRRASSETLPVFSRRGPGRK